MAGWAGLIGLDGTSIKLLPPAQATMVPFSLAYSADGLFLAVSLFDSNGAQGLAIYSANGKLRRWLPGERAGPWSPSGHTLALMGPNGVRLLREPDAPDAAPERVGPAGCTGMVWRP